jgi:hypothetical protein
MSNSKVLKTDEAQGMLHLAKGFCSSFKKRWNLYATFLEPRWIIGTLLGLCWNIAGILLATGETLCWDLAGSG